MTVLQIEHKVTQFDRWKKAFDNNPIDRKKSGVKRYRVYRPVDDPNYAIIDLEFETLKDAKAMLVGLGKLWQNVDGTIMVNPKTRILDVIDLVEY